MLILNFCYLACQDHTINAPAILELLPPIVSAFLGKVPEGAITLISGIINLNASVDNKEKKIAAIEDLSTAFGCDEEIVAGLLAISKGDWEKMK